jgi:TRAP-type mannitol/chloroaromatic compound transport system permease small subunit
MIRSRLKKIVNIFDKISEWTGKIVSWIIVLIVGIILYEVIARYIFNKPTVWAVESSTMLHGVFLVFGGVYAMFTKSHVNMDLFYIKWSKRKRAIVDLCTFPLTIILFLTMLYFLTYYGIESLIILEHSHSPWSPPLYYSKMLLPVGLILIILQGIGDFIRNLTLAITGRELS